MRFVIVQISIRKNARIRGIMGTFLDREQKKTEFQDSATPGYCRIRKGDGFAGRK